MLVVHVRAIGGQLVRLTLTLLLVNIGIHALSMYLP